MNYLEKSENSNNSDKTMIAIIMTQLKQYCNPYSQLNVACCHKCMLKLFLTTLRHEKYKKKGTW